MGLTERVAACLDDAREPGKVRHETIESAPAASLRAVRRLRRLQRCRPAGARPDPQADGGCQAVHLPGAGAGRLRRGDAEQPAARQACPAADANSWTRRRRVIIKAEVVRHPGRAPKNNPRFVVTTLTAPPAVDYALYCQRGDVENRLKELHHGLEMDRTSCSKFRANQFRVLLTLAAYILFHELRRRTATTADTQVTTLRERVVKLAVWVERSARRFWVSTEGGSSAASGAIGVRAP